MGKRIKEKECCMWASVCVRERERVTCRFAKEIVKGVGVSGE